MKRNYPKQRICQYAKKYCAEDISLIENYTEMMADNTQTWCCHHRRETDENKSRSSLIKEGRYFGVPACELIFLTASDHVALHKKGVPLSEEHKQHVSEATKAAMSRPDVKKRLSEAMKGVPKSEEHKQHVSEALKGVPLSEERKQHISEAMNRPDVKKRWLEAMKGRKWWNDGTKTVLAKECPGEGFKPGRGSLKRLL